MDYLRKAYFRKIDKMMSVMETDSGTLPFLICAWLLYQTDWKELLKAEHITFEFETTDVLGEAVYSYFGVTYKLQRNSFIGALKVLEKSGIVFQCRDKPDRESQKVLELKPKNYLFLTLSCESIRTNMDLPLQAYVAPIAENEEFIRVAIVAMGKIILENKFTSIWKIRIFMYFIFNLSSDDKYERLSYDYAGFEELVSHIGAYSSIDNFDHSNVRKALCDLESIDSKPFKYHSFYLADEGNLNFHLENDNRLRVTFNLGSLINHSTC